MLFSEATKKHKRHKRAIGTNDLRRKPNSFLIYEENQTLLDLRRPNSFSCFFVPFLWLHLSQHFTRDDDSLNLGGPFSDRAQLRVAPVLLGWIVFRVTIPAVDLDRFFANMNAHFGCKELGHRRFFRRLLALILHPRSAIHQKSRSVDLRCHVCQLELDCLKLGDWFSKLLTLFCITHG